MEHAQRIKHLPCSEWNNFPLTEFPGQLFELPLDMTLEGVQEDTCLSN